MRAMKIEKIIGIGLVLVLVVSTAFVQPLANNTIVDKENDPPFIVGSTHWADSVFLTMTPDERTAQLFMVAAYSNQGEKHIAKIEKLVTQNKIGGLIFMQGGPLRQAELINRY